MMKASGITNHLKRSFSVSIRSVKYRRIGGRILYEFKVKRPYGLNRKHLIQIQEELESNFCGCVVIDESDNRDLHIKIDADAKVGYNK